MALGPLEVAVGLMDAWLKCRLISSSAASQAYPGVPDLLGEKREEGCGLSLASYWDNMLMGQARPGFI